MRTAIAPVAELLHWTLRQHSSHVSTRSHSAGWEFVTAEDARAYVSHQYERCSAFDHTLSPFRAEVKSNGVYTHFWDSQYGAIVRKATYAPGTTMRDATIVPSPSDCFWMVPGTGHES